MQETKPLTSGQLETVCKALADTNEGLTGSEIVLIRKYFKSLINNRLYLAIGGESEGRIADLGV